MNLEPHYGEEALATVESSHDTFDSKNFKNWLANNAGLGIYAHGRIHQQTENLIYVSDLIHKRGHLTSEDILLMEEQALLSMGDPLSVPTRLGQLQALEILPTMNTANGEGSLIAYYERGVVAFDTFEIPRETRHDGEGKLIQKGWDMKRLVNHLLNTLGAVGRYSVVALTRDHLFRSKRGLHFLKTVAGEGSFNTENTNRLSMDVDPLLQADAEENLTGAACGFWIAGDRMLATTGLVRGTLFSSSSFGRGFVVWNQATTFTEDRTPLPLWEGLWVPDYCIKGIHKFSDLHAGEYGFICSDREMNVYQVAIDQSINADIRCGEEIPIEWSFDTGAVAPAGLSNKVHINGCVIELVVSNYTQKFRLMARTDTDPTWRVWSEFSPPVKDVASGQKLLFTESVGKPASVTQRECTWIQVRLEGLGAAEVRLIDLDFSPSTAKIGRTQTYITAGSDKDPFEINSTPSTERW